MKKTTRFFALCLAMTMCATMAMTGALGEATATPVAENTAAPTEAVATATPAPDAVLATVNGEQITYAQMQEKYEYLFSQYTSQGYDLTGQEALLQSMALDWSVQELVLRQKAAELKVDQFTAEEEAGFATEAQTTWDSYLTQQAANYLTSETPTDEEKAAAKTKAEEYIAQNGYTAEKALAELVSSYRDQKIQERLTDMLTKDLAAFTDDEIQKEYQTRVDKDTSTYSTDIGSYEYATQYYKQQVWYVPEGMRGITHILLEVDSALLDKYKSIQAQLEEQNDNTETVDETASTAAPEATASPTLEPTATPDPAATATPAPATQADLDAARQAILDSVKAKTDDIYARLKAGETFSALMAEYGTDPGMKQEPNMTEGYSVHANSVLYDPVFVQGAYSAEMQKVGDVSQPVVSSFGVHILNYVRDIPGGPVQLTDELKTSLRTELEQARKDDALPNALKEWQAAAEISYTDLAPARISTED